MLHEGIAGVVPGAEEDYRCAGDERPERGMDPTRDDHRGTGEQSEGVARRREFTHIYVVVGDAERLGGLERRRMQQQNDVADVRTGPAAVGKSHLGPQAGRKDDRSGARLPSLRGPEQERRTANEPTIEVRVAGCSVRERIATAEGRRNETCDAKIGRSGSALQGGAEGENRR